MAAGYTTVQYNGITLVNCLTRRFDQEAVMDDTGTDLLYHRFSIRVVGYVLATGDSQQGTVYTTPGPSVTSAAFNFAAVRHQLGEFRKPFAMTMGVSATSAGTPLLTAIPYSSPGAGDNSVAIGVDLNNGPKPRVLSVTHLSSDQAFRVEFEIEICLNECSGVYNLPSAVISNRWSVVDELTKDFWTTRTYSGRLKLAAPVDTPNAFRGWVVPSVQPGMRREKIIFDVAPDQLTMAWTVIDQEVIFSAPLPATSWSFSHTESAVNNFTLSYGSISVSLSAPRDVPRVLLIVLAGSIIDSRLILSLFDDAIPPNPVHPIVEEYSIIDEVSDGMSTIRASCRMRRAASTTNIPQFWNNIYGAKIGQPLDTPGDRFTQTPLGSVYNSNLSYNGYPDPNTGLSPPPLTSGPISPAAAFACYLQDPCVGVNQITATQQTGSSYSTGPATYQADVVIRQTADLPKYSNNLVSVDHVTAPYTHYRQDSKYKQKKTRVHLPVAIPPTQSGSQSQSQIYQYFGGPGAQPPANVQGPQTNNPPFNPTSVVVSLVPPMFERIVRIEAERVGLAPVLPTPQDVVAASTPPPNAPSVIVQANGADPNQAPTTVAPPNMYLMDWEYLGQNADSLPDGQLLFRVCAEYTFALDRPPDMTNLLIGNAPQYSFGYQTTMPEALTGGLA